jgi:hypothetical protein
MAPWGGSQIVVIHCPEWKHPRQVKSWSGVIGQVWADPWNHLA